MQWAQKLYANGPLWPYHHWSHTWEVALRSQQLALQMGLDGHQCSLLRAAAYCHDLGHLVKSAEHEALSVEMAKPIWDELGFSQWDQEQMAAAIRATRIPQKADDLMAQILCDADLFYLGGPDYYPQAEKLYREMKMRGSSLSRREWLDLQIHFLEQHHYWTEPARPREKEKQKRLEELKNQANK